MKDMKKIVTFVKKPLDRPIMTCPQCNKNVHKVCGDTRTTFCNPCLSLAKAKLLEKIQAKQRAKRNLVPKKEVSKRIALQNLEKNKKAETQQWLKKRVFLEKHFYNLATNTRAAVRLEFGTYITFRHAASPRRDDPRFTGIVFAAARLDRGGDSQGGKRSYYVVFVQPTLDVGYFFFCAVYRPIDHSLLSFVDCPELG